MTKMRVLLSGWGLVVTMMTTASWALTIKSGDLQQYLATIEYGEKDDAIWQQPSPQNLIDFASAFDHLLAGDYMLADQFAANTGYQVVEYTDTAHGASQKSYLLREINPVPSPDARGGGTYVLNPQGSAVALQAPHPISDLYTGAQAIDALFRVAPRITMFAGTHRKSAIGDSPCTGDHRASDVVHGVDNFFYVAHQRISLERLDTVFVQLHGFGSESLRKLKMQCEVKTQRLINLSEGVNYPTDPAADSLMHALRRRIDADRKLKVCVFGNDTSLLGGTTNSTGRFTNGSTDPCSKNAAVSSTRFVHVEQSYEVRSGFRDSLVTHLRNAIDDYFSQ